jgi:predicted secreted protein
MFTDNRSRKIILVSHCLLNQNSISDGTADFPSQFREIIALLMANQVGIIQLPCPELFCLGLDRQDKRGAQRDLLQENTRIRKLLLQKKPTALLRKKAQEAVAQIREYKKHGFSIVGLLGINRSPSCGIETTSLDGKEQLGMGVFVQLIADELQAKGLELKMTGVKTSRVEESLEKVRQLLHDRG